MADDQGTPSYRSGEGSPRGGDEYGGTGYDEEAVFGGENEYVDEGGYNEDHHREDPSGGVGSGEAYVALLVVVGAILVLVPEPVTSALGGLLLGLGILGWLFDLVS